MRQLRTLAAIGYSLAIALIWAALAWRITTVPQNHVGLPVTALYGVALAAPPLMYMNRHSTITVAGLALLAVLHCAGIFALGHTNTLLPYEVWIAKKMPDRPAALRRILGYHLGH
jgi:hypothetical protein